MKKRLASLLSAGLFTAIFEPAAAQDIRVKKNPGENSISVSAGGKPFTQFFYPDSLEKPVLYPIYAPDGELITRGFPIKPRPNEQVDHPHHLGLWLNYESVNGLDFWNNSYAIPKEKKAHYGWIRTTAVTKTSGGKTGTIAYTANWQDIRKKVLMEEKTDLQFSVVKKAYVIDRTTTLTAKQDVSMPDIKDGMLGLRVTRELELPSDEEREYRDDKGNVTKIKASNDKTLSGNYLSSEGIQGDSVWSTRGRWCLLYGKKGADSLSVAIIDHPKNVGYPTYWHARGYGLFAANPLGQKIFSKDRETLNFHLKKGESVTFRYRVVIASGANRLSKTEVDALADAFAGM
ncbi:MAG: PmoA family protein [Mucilaginibacter polytrichastri]|nr:PmoA family protein [Mucilaginibacter polytrichastri]